MGGAVVGGVRDSSAVYYNPGALAFVEESGLSLSASALRYGRLEIEEALGSGKALDDTFYDVVPLLIRRRLARRRPARDRARAGRRLPRRVAPPATLYEPPEHDARHAHRPAHPLFDSTFYQFSLLGRIGVSLEPAPWLKVGLTATTPGLELYGEGEEQAEIIFASTALGDANFRSLQERLDTNHRAPWRAALGFEVAPAPDWRLGVSVEYVDRLPGRPVIETDPSRDFFAGTPQFVGASPGLELIEDDSVGSPLAASAIDVYHAVLGLSRRTRDRVLALGVTGSYGTGRIAGNLDFVGQDALLGLGSLPAVVERKASYFSTSLVISFTQLF